MIGTHDSLTGDGARWLVWHPVSFLWRTQRHSVWSQMADGARYLDIRVRRTKSGWRACHGLVDLRWRFATLDGLLDLFGDRRIRLILERGSSLEFETLVQRLAEAHGNLSFACVKKGWRVLVDRDPEIRDYTFTPWLSGNTLRMNLRRLWGMRRGPLTIKSWARTHNPPVNNDIVASETVHFMDYL